MSDFVDDRLPLVTTKTDATARRGRITQNIMAADYNDATKAALSLRDRLLGENAPNVHGLAHNATAPVSAAAQVLMRSLSGKLQVSENESDWYQLDGEVVNVKEFGALGNSTTGSDGHDDTAAIIAALEVANGVAAGTWITGHDPTAIEGVPPRRRRPLFFPASAGMYRVTSRIPINWRGVVIQGPERGNYGPYEGYSARIVADHDGDTFAVNADYNPNGFTMRNLEIVKLGAHVGTGMAVRVEGTEYVYGMTFENVMELNHLRGLHIVCQGTKWLTGHVYGAASYVSSDIATWYSAAGGTSGATAPNGVGPTFNDGGITWTRVSCPPEGPGTQAMADLKVKNCQWANNSEWGIYVYGAIAVGEIRRNSINTNGVGGIFCGGKSLEIIGNLLEGQNRPLCVIASTASQEVTIEHNYFELCATGSPTTTAGLIEIALCNGFTLDHNNVYGDQGADVPKALVRSCINGYVDTEAAMIDCSNVQTLAGPVIAAAGVAEKALSCAWNMCQGLPPSGASAVSETRGWLGTAGTVYTKVGGRLWNATKVDDPDYRVLFSGTGNVGIGEYGFIQVAIHYESEVPHAPVLFQLIGTNAGDTQVRKEWTFTPHPATKIGDTVVYQIGWLNETGLAFTSVGVYCNPYGQDTTPGNGARIVRGIGWTPASPKIGNLNIFDLIAGIASSGSGAPTEGTWSPGDRVDYVPAASGKIGAVCTAYGTPGTWKDYGAIDA